MSRKKKNTIIIIAVILAGLLVFSGIYYKTRLGVHSITIDNRAFQDNFKGYGVVNAGAPLTIKIPLQLITSKYPLPKGDILCFTTDPALSSLKIDPWGKVNTIPPDSFCLKDSTDTNYTVAIKGIIPRKGSNETGQKKYIYLSIWKKEPGNKKLVQRFINQYYFINKKGQKVYLKDLKGIDKTMPVILKVIRLLSISR